MIFGWKTKPEWITVYKHRDAEREKNRVLLEQLRMAREEAEMRYCAVKVHDHSRIMQGMRNVLSQPNDQG